MNSKAKTTSTNSVQACANCKNTFTIEPDDFTFYEKIKVPAPTFCWLCRAQRRFAFRNERILYKRKDDLTGNEIFTMYAPDSDLKVYDVKEWLSDKWDPLSYGRDVDFSKSFLEQFKELLRTVPLKSRNIVNGINSEYCNNITDPKNSYLVFNASNPEECCYGNAVNFSKDCFDTSHISKCETCYESFWLTSCSKCFFSAQCENCFDMWFSKNCVGCQNCFGCVGLRNKSYYIWNEPYKKEEYEQKIKSFNLCSYENIKKLRDEARAFWLKFPNRYMEGLHNTNVSGNYIDHCKNVRDSFLVRESENMRFCQYAQETPGCKDCYDYSIWGDNVQLSYECHASGINVSDSKFCLFVQENSRNLEYCMVCQNSANLFGCISLRKAQYCILNKQYSKEEYEQLTGKIREQMNAMPYTDSRGRIYKYGEYFPIEISPVAYNESMAQEYFPLTKEQALEQGYRWKDTADRSYKITLQSSEIPNDINDIDDSILDQIISCSHAGQCTQLCTTAFRIIQRELDFYKRFNLPLPRLCPNCRTFERLKQRSGLQLFKRTCMCKSGHSHGSDKCRNEFETSYSPDRPEIVYCESCYQAEVI